MRVKSTPSRSNASSCSVSSMESASGLGHLYFPCSRRLYQIASPVRSQIIAFTRSERFPRKRNRSPPMGFASNVSVMMAHRPEKPFQSVKYASGQIYPARPGGRPTRRGHLPAVLSGKSASSSSARSCVRTGQCDRRVVDTADHRPANVARSFHHARQGDTARAKCRFLIPTAPDSRRRNPAPSSNPTISARST